jgi:hypothetical protein
LMLAIKTGAWWIRRGNSVIGLVIAGATLILATAIAFYPVIM